MGGPLHSASYLLKRRDILRLAAAFFFLIPEDNFMKQMQEGFGKLNPKAPSVLSRFAFLVGAWEFEAKLKLSDGSPQKFHGTWDGHFILDGYAIADEFVMRSSSGEVIVLGMNYRTYEVAKQAWNVRWLNALTGAWTDLASAEFGGVKISDHSISYHFREPVASQTFTRATYTNISSEAFTWIGEKSDDGTAWADFMTVECRRRPR